MAELATIARPYAEALFRVAQKSNLSAWADLVSEMSQAAQNKDVIALVQNPKVPAAKVAEIFVSVLKSPTNQEVKNFIDTLANYSRLLLFKKCS